MKKKLLRAEVASLKRQAADQVANLQMQQQEDDKVSQQLPSQEADHTDILSVTPTFCLSCNPDGRNMYRSSHLFFRNVTIISSSMSMCMSSSATSKGDFATLQIGTCPAAHEASTAPTASSDMKLQLGSCADVVIAVVVVASRQLDWLLLCCRCPRPSA